MATIFGATSTRQLNAALMVLRLILGAVFIAHGAQKVFVYGFAGVAGAFGGMGVPFAGVVGPAIALLELFGGIAIVLGLLTRPFAALLAATMIGAMVLVHLPAGFFAPDGVEFTLSLFGMALAMTLTGAGAWSVDGFVAREPSRAGVVAPKVKQVETRRVA